MSGESQVVFYNDLEVLTPTDIQRVGKLASRDLADILGYLTSQRGVDQTAGVGVRAAVIDGLRVTAQTVPNMTVQADVGAAVIPASGTSGVVGSPAATTVDSNMRLVNKRAASLAIAISAAHATLPRYDLIELGPAVTAPDTVEKDEERTVDLYDTTLKRYVPSGSPRIKMRHGEGEVFVTAGTPGSGNACPTPTAGRVPIAVVRVLAGVTSITQQDIFDVRQFLGEELEGAGRSPTWIETSEISIDVPADAGTARKTVVNLDVSVRGVRGAFRTDALFQLDNTAGTKAFDSFLDANFTDSGTFTGWVYLYMVVTDDKGLRYSRASCTTEVDVAGAQYSHAGVFVVSKIAPSLTNGSLAPSAAIKTPLRAGSSTCTPGTGKAICVGVVWWQSARFQHGIRMFDGECTFVEDDNLIPACFFGSWTHTPAGAASALQVSTFQADLDLATNPKGPIAFDIYTIFAITSTTGLTLPQRLRVYEKKASDATVSRLLAMYETTWAEDGLTQQARGFVFPNVPVSRISSQRGSTTNGVLIQLESGAIGGTVHTAELTSGAPPTTKLYGYRWPQGPCIA